MVVNSSVVSVPNNENKNKNIKAGLAGLFIGNSMNIVAKTAAGSIAGPNMIKINSSLSADQFDKVQNAIETAFKNTNLKDKGVEIVKAESKNFDDVVKLLVNEQNGGLRRLIPKKLKEGLAVSTAEQLTQGHNAFYTVKANKILIPKNNKMVLANFHEMGHALNANASKFGKLLQKTRGISALALPILLISVFKNKKKEGEQPKNGLDKATDFVKNNAGKLTFAAMVPMLLEEGLATIKGNGLAKKALNPELFKKVSKTNALGFASYAVAAVGAALSVTLANKIRDKIVENQGNKQSKNV